MKIKFSHLLKPVSLLMAALLFAVLVITPVQAIQISSASFNVVTKMVNSGETLSFSASDFAETAAEAREIRLSTLPVETLGILKIGGEAAEVGDEIDISELQNLTFSACSKPGSTAVFEVSAIADDGSVKNVAVIIRVKAGANHAPIAENLDFTTYKGIGVKGTLRAVDPEGDLVSFTVVAQPRKGTVELRGDTFVYKPADGKKGRDSFTYTAKDSAGNVSAEAKVQILITKQKTEVSYSDMEGNGAHYAALSLAENDVFVGEKLGTSYFFSPDTLVTRGEFLAMCLRACGMEAIHDIANTGFADDADMPLWVKPYVSSALLSGIIKGYQTESGTLVFSADTPVTYAEAAVTLNNILEISDVTAGVPVEAELVPSWAYQAAVNLASCDIMPANASVMAGGYMTRADVASMLCSAMRLIEERGGNSLLSWAR